jgi:hypothetical protein
MIRKKRKTFRAYHQRRSLLSLPESSKKTHTVDKETSDYRSPFPLLFFRPVDLFKVASDEGECAACTARQDLCGTYVRNRDSAEEVLGC